MHLSKDAFVDMDNEANFRSLENNGSLRQGTYQTDQTAQLIICQICDDGSSKLVQQSG